MVVNFNGPVHQAQVNEEGGTGYQYQINSVAPGDQGQLMNALIAAGVSELDVKSLTTALEEDRNENGGADPKRPGNRVAKWLRDVGGKVAIGASGGIVAGLVKQYFDLK